MVLYIEAGVDDTSSCFWRHAYITFKCHYKSMPIYFYTAHKQNAPPTSLIWLASKPKYLMSLSWVIRLSILDI